MKIPTVLIFLSFCCLSSYAASSSSKEDLTKLFESSMHLIDTHLDLLHQVNDILIEDKLDYSQMSYNYPELFAKVNLSNKVSAGIFENHPDSPIGIPAFWWGFCLTWAGLLVVYLSMDEGPDREEQVNKALRGCLISTLIAIAAYVSLLTFILPQ